MRKPELRDFGISQEDVAWATSIEYHTIVVALLVSTLGWVLYGLLTAGSFSLASVILALIFGFIPVFITGLVLYIAALVLLHGTSYRYRQAQKYQSSVKNFRAWWVRTQTEFWRSLSGSQFEAELAALFRRAGYNAELTGFSGDEGVDIWLDTELGKKIVQCKAHHSPVGPAVVRELYGTQQHFGAAGAILASTSGFTKGVIEYVRDKPIELYALPDIIALQEKHGL
jgi:HJR/Mrr/RecB family endonuclease